MARTPRLRRIRHLHYDRTTRQKNLSSFFVAQQTVLNGTGTGATVTAAAGMNITWTGHAKTVGKGPFLFTTAGTLPAGLQLLTQYWISEVVDANTVRVSTCKGGPNVVMTNAGTGVHTITKASSARSVFEYLKQSGPAVLKASLDVDNL